MWEVKDVTGWPEENRDTRGVREKRWVRAPDGSLWLFKLPRRSRPIEPAVEWFVLALARETGVESAEAFVGVDVVEGREVRGSLVRRFLDGKEASLVSGSQLLHGSDPGYDDERHELHTLTGVRRALSALPGASVEVTRMAHVLALDAWVGNADRHQGNWSVVESRGGERRFSPMYDPATCLGVELQDGNPLLTASGRTIEALERYASRCPSGFGDGTSMLSMDGVVAEARRWPEWEASIDSWLESFHRAFSEVVDPLLAEAPDSWWPSERKELARQLLVRRLERLVRDAVGDPK